MTMWGDHLAIWGPDDCLTLFNNFNVVIFFYLFSLKKKFLYKGLSI